MRGPYPKNEVFCVLDGALAIRLYAADCDCTCTRRSPTDSDIVSEPQVEQVSDGFGKHRLSVTSISIQ